MQRSMSDIPEKQRWTPPSVERTQHLSAYPVIEEFISHEKTVLRAMGLDPEKAPENFNSIILAWVDSLAATNAPLPMKDGMYCGMRDFLDWVDDIKHKVGENEAKNAVKEHLSFLFTHPQKKDSPLAEMAHDFLESPAIPHIRKFVFVCIGKKKHCMRILNPDYFRRTDTHLYFLRDLLPTGQVHVYGSAIAFSWQSYGEKNILLKLNSYRRKLSDLVAGKKPSDEDYSHTNDLTGYAIDLFTELDMDRADQKMLLENAILVTDALVDRAMRETCAHAIETNMRRFAEKAGGSEKYELLNFPSGDDLGSGEWQAEAVCLPSRRHISMEMTNGVISVSVDNETVCEAERDFFVGSEFASFVENLEILEKPEPTPSMGM